MEVLRGKQKTLDGIIKGTVSRRVAKKRSKT